MPQGWYVAMDDLGVKALFDNLRDAISFMRRHGREPVFELDNE